jgi:cell division GTPase FtsZ
MLKVGIIGIGNAGSQVASLAYQELKIPAMCINSSEKDLETIPDGIPRKLISDTEGFSKGAGKDRSLAKAYLKDSIMPLISSEEFKVFMTNLDFVFVISSTGGGTGSGAAPLITSIINSAFPDTKTILIGILPVEGEALIGHVNTLEYLDELYKVMPDQTYMLYDNESYIRQMPSYQMMEKVNHEIVNDINVLRCYYNYTTKYDSIDDKDMSRLISYPGRLSVYRLDAFKDKDVDTKSIESLMIDTIKRNAQVEAQRDKKLMASGIITNLSQTIAAEFNDAIPEIKNFVGEPITEFKHIYINEDRNMENNVFLILSGLTPINDRIYKITDTVNEIEEKQRIMEEENAISGVSISTLTDKVADAEKPIDTSDVDISAIFSKFNA